MTGCPEDGSIHRIVQARVPIAIGPPIVIDLLGIDLCAHHDTMFGWLLPHLPEAQVTEHSFGPVGEPIGSIG